MKTSRILISLFVLSVSCVPLSCRPKPTFLIENYLEQRPARIAVLPVFNETVDLDGPPVFREIIQRILLEKGYRCPSVEEVDKVLAREDILEAGQVKILLPREIGEILQVDGILYSTVTTWNTRYFVYYASISVGGRFELVGAANGEKLWETEHKVTARKIPENDSPQELAEILAWASLQGYRPYVEAMIKEVFEKLP